MPEKRLTRQTVKIGFFTLLAIVILYLGITYLKGLSISARSKTYYVSMTDVTGINVATRVFVNGYKVGSVRKMEYDYRNNGETILTLTLDPDIKLPQGTQVQVAQTLLSGALVNLVLPEVETGAYLNAKDTIPMSTHRSAKSLEQLQSEFVPRLSTTLSRMDSVLIQANAILSNPNIEPTLADVRQSARHINASSAQLQQSLRSLPTIMGRIDHTSANVESFASRLDSLQLQETVANLESTSRELKSFTQRLNQSNGTVGRLLNEDGLYNRIDSVTTSLDALIRDIKANPKKYVKLSLF
ncbi:MlaD family protein [uncultured Porphyromonas sp.]|jgi:phospholipid/cholesterol/gamma-HCH transport system substrate-binding protein|uniref:MlaD family protein n=1 Tax=uncultured Porphyromonas sp. TaxID=159274 RepID=UPI002602E5F3|nr:MlaD family protein [uncultured Porphyromonas sp.]